MTVKRCILLMVMSAVIWTAWSGALPRPARSISSHGRSLVKRDYPKPQDAKPPKYIKPKKSTTTPPPTTTPTTTTPPTTTDPGACFYEGEYYEDGEYIEQEPCYYIICLGGGVAIGDIFCETPDGCNLNWPPNECCSLCENATSSTVTPTTAPPGCTENCGHYSYQSCVFQRNSCGNTGCGET